LPNLWRFTTANLLSYQNLRFESTKFRFKFKPETSYFERCFCGLNTYKFLYNGVYFAVAQFLCLSAFLTIPDLRIIRHYMHYKAKIESVFSGGKYGISARQCRDICFYNLSFSHQPYFKFFS